jgi:hypothetical protein
MNQKKEQRVLGLLTKGQPNPEKAAFLSLMVL